jgi:hypothetical protein
MRPAGRGVRSVVPARAASRCRGSSAGEQLSATAWCWLKPMRPTDWETLCLRHRARKSRPMYCAPGSWRNTMPALVPSRVATGMLRACSTSSQRRWSHTWRWRLTGSTPSPRRPHFVLSRSCCIVRRFTSRRNLAISSSSSVLSPSRSPRSMSSWRTQLPSARRPGRGPGQRRPPCGAGRSPKPPRFCRTPWGFCPFAELAQQQGSSRSPLGMTTSHVEVSGQRGDGQGQPAMPGRLGDLDVPAHLVEFGPAGRELVALASLRMIRLRVCRRWVDMVLGPPSLQSGASDPHKLWTITGG